MGDVTLMKLLLREIEGGSRSITRFFQFHFTAIGPVNDRAIGQDTGHSDQRDSEHDGERSFAAGRVQNRHAVRGIVTRRN